MSSSTSSSTAFSYSNFPTVTLSNESEFHQLAPEINEQSLTARGRFQFPAPKFELTGLDPNTEYRISLKFTAASNNKCKYVDDKWIVEPREPSSEYPDVVFNHPRGAQFGYEWLNGGEIEFEAKLSNSKSQTGSKDTVYLQSMIKYTTSLLINKVQRNCQGLVMHVGAPMEFPFKELDFITVTRYRSPKVILFKNENKFSSALRKKRRHSDDSDNSVVSKCSKLSDSLSETSSESLNTTPVTPPSRPPFQQYNINVQVDNSFQQQYWNYQYGYMTHYNPHFMIPQYGYPSYYSDAMTRSFGTFYPHY